MDTALLIPGGGMRTAFGAGFIQGSKIRPEQFNAVHAVSAAFVPAAHFVARQMHLSEKTWVEELTSSLMFSYRRLFSLTDWPARPQNIVDLACRELDYAAIERSKTKLIINTVRLSDGQTVFHKIGIHNGRDVFKATCAIPFYAPSMKIWSDELCDNERHVDGGVEHPLPVEHVYNSGCKKILVIGNQPIEHETRGYGPLASWLAFPTSEPARKAFRNRAKNAAASRDFINNPPSDARILHIVPNRPLPAHHVSRSKEDVRYTYWMGMVLGSQMHNQVHAFLDEKN